MKKFLTYLLVGFICLTLTGCGDKKNSDGGEGNKQQDQSGKGTVASCTETKSNDSFVDKYDYADAVMMPDDGVYTGYVDQNIMEGVGYFYFVVDCLTKEGLDNYKAKLLANGYENRYGAYINTEKNTKIVISDYVSSMNYINVYVYPTID